MIIFFFQTERKADTRSLIQKELQAIRSIFSAARERIFIRRGELKNEIENLQHILRNVHSAVNQSSIVSRTDLQGRITYANDNFVRVSGYSGEELLGQHHNIVNSGYHPKSFWTAMWKQVAGGQTWRNEVCNLAKDGRLYWVDTFIYPLYDIEGKLREFLSIRNDITLRKNHEMAIDKQNKVLSEIAWSQAHEIRRPVASILGLIHLMQLDNTLPDQEMIKHLKTMAEELDFVIRRNVSKSSAVDVQQATSIKRDYFR